MDISNGQIKPFGPILEAELDLTIVDLLTDDMQRNTKKVKEILPHLSDHVLCLKPSKAGAEDIFIWKPTSSEVYSTKPGYSIASMNRGINQTPLSESLDWVRDVWSSDCSQKMKVLIWSIIQRVLPLGENLQRRWIQDQGLCVRCKEKESTMHFFFEYPFAKYVWKKILLHKVVSYTNRFQRRYGSL